MALPDKIEPLFFWKNAGLWILLYCVGQGAMVRAAEPISWKTGAEFSKALQAPVGFHWQDRTLRDGLGSLSREYRVAIWLDRRIDPDQKVTYQVRDVPLMDCLEQWGRQKKLAVVKLGSTLLLLPEPAAQKLSGILSTKKAEIASFDATTRTRWLAPTKLTWEAATPPSDLVAQLESELASKCGNADTLPHDLWPGWQGPPLTRLEWLTLLLLSFDLTFATAEQGRSFQLMPIPEVIVYDHIYTVSGDVTEKGKAIKRQFPHLPLRREGNSGIGVTASTEEHATIAEFLGEKKVTSPMKVKPGVKTYALTAKNEPRGAILKTVAADLGVEFKFAEELRMLLSERVSVSVKQVTAEELLRQILEPINLQYQLDAKTLTILKKE